MAESTTKDKAYWEKQYRELKDKFDKHFNNPLWENRYYEEKNKCQELKTEKATLSEELRQVKTKFDRLDAEKKQLERDISIKSGLPQVSIGGKVKEIQEYDAFIVEKDKLINKLKKEVDEIRTAAETNMAKKQTDTDKMERQVKAINNSLAGQRVDFEGKLREKDKEIFELKRLSKRSEGIFAATNASSNTKDSTKDVKDNTKDIEIVPAKTIKQASSMRTYDIENNNNGNINNSELIGRLEFQLRQTEQELRLKNEEVSRLKAAASLAAQHSSSSAKSHKSDIHVSRDDHHIGGCQTTAAQAAMIADLEGKLREANWRVSQLQSQNEFINAKSSNVSQSQKLSDDQVDNLTSKVRELRRALEDLRYEKELADSKVTRMEELEEQTSELKQANRSLEDKIARLCEAPFINDAFSQQESRLRYDDALREREELNQKVDHLQEAVRMHFAALTSLKQQAAQVRQEREDSVRKLEEFRVKYEESEAGKNLLQDKLRLYSGDDGIDVESLERALTLVKRKSEALDRLPFLEDIDGDNSNLVTLPLVRRKLEEVQMSNIRLSSEVENMEGMLKLQTAINRDLQKELEILNLKKDKDKGDLIHRCNDFEQLAMKRLEKINRLESQLKQYVYSSVKSKTDSNQKHMPFNNSKLIDDKASIASDGDNALLRDWIQQCDDANGPGQLPSDENLMEVWVRSATFKDGVVSPGSSTFVVIDFFDCESQTTSIQASNNPKYDFAARYKVIVDDFYIRYLATDTISFDINLARSLRNEPQHHFK